MNYLGRFLIALLVAVRLTLQPLAANADSPYIALHSFATGMSHFTGSPLLLAADGNFYGVAFDGNGIIYRVTPTGTVSVVHIFSGTGGNVNHTPTELTAGIDGSIYGITPWGGVDNLGTVFKVTTTGTFTTLHSFDGANGAYPVYAVTQAGDGSLYGTARKLTTSGALGTIVYKISPAGTYSVLHTFTATEGDAGLDALALANDGNLYGESTTCFYRITPAGTLTILRVARLVVEGQALPERMLAAADGNLYGTNGVQPNPFSSWIEIFKLTTAGALTGVTGSQVTGNLIQGADGRLYARTWPDAAYGSIVSMTTEGEAYKRVGLFAEEPGSNDAGGITFGPDGNLYGAKYSASTQAGGIFKMTPSGAVGNIATSNGGSALGYAPSSGVVQAGDGTFYGVTANGGPTNSGTVFKMAAVGNGSTTTLHNFSLAEGGRPNCLILGNDGNLYGTTPSGASGKGSIFQVTTGGVFTVLHDFNGNDGRLPTGLACGPDGNIYGTTQLGGSLHNSGEIFRITPQGTFTLLFAFDNTNAYPVGSPLILSDGTLYGAAEAGGQNGAGIVYSRTLTGTMTVLHSFGASFDARYPTGGLVQGIDGALYGTASGEVYRIHTDGSSYELLTGIQSGPNLSITGTLTAAPDGFLYGSASYDLSPFNYNWGGIFRIAPDSNLVDNVHVFQGDIDGSAPNNGLLIGQDGQLYGTAAGGGQYGGGSVFKVTLAAPTTPTGVALQTWDRHIVVKWPRVYGAITYNVYRGTTPGGEGATPFRTGLTTPSLTDVTVGTHGTYYYKVTAVNGLGESARSTEVHGTMTATAVTFVGTDTSNQGNWRDRYGAEGHDVFNGSGQVYPDTVAVNFGSVKGYGWSSTSISPAALQPDQGTTPYRIAEDLRAASWTVNVSVAGTHQLSLYLLDYANAGDAQTITLKDAVTGTTLDTRSATNFSNGVYYTWNVTGNVNVTFTTTASGHYAVMSGIFFGGPAGPKSPAAPANLTATSTTNGGHLTWSASPGATSYYVFRSTSAGAETGPAISSALSATSFNDITASPGMTYYYKVVAVNTFAGGFPSAEATVTIPTVSSSATFVKTDANTHGTWKGVYGVDGYNVIGDTSGPNPSYPSYATVTPSSHMSGVWTSSSIDLGCLQKVASGSADRMAGLWYNTSWSMNVGVTGTHQLALYFFDFPNADYAESITVRDTATGQLLDTRSLSSCIGGVYEVWNVSGNVTITLTSTAGHWAPVSGIFFG